LSEKGVFPDINQITDAMFDAKLG